MKRYFSFFALLGLCLHGSAVFCHPPEFNPRLPITIRADAASIEQLKHQATYTGNVIMTQGDHELRADTLTIQKDPHGRLHVITAHGNPAHFVGKRANDPEPLYATAKMIHYYPDKQLVVLEGSAALQYHHDKFEGPTLSYHFEKQVISASSHNQERPTVILQPREQS